MYFTIIQICVHSDSEVEYDLSKPSPEGRVRAPLESREEEHNQCGSYIEEILDPKRRDRTTNLIF